MNISITEIKHQIIQVINEVHSKGTQVVITSNGEPIAAIVSAKDIDSKLSGDKATVCQSNELFSIKDAAKMIGITHARVLQLAHEGKVQFRKEGKQYFLSKQEVERLEVRYKLLTLEEAATLLEISTNDVINLAHEKKLFLSHTKKGYRITKQSIQEYLKTKTSSQELLESQNPEQFISLEEAAAFLQISIASVLNLAHENTIELVHNSEGYKISKSQIQKFLHHETPSQEVSLFKLENNASSKVSSDFSTLEQFITIRKAAEILGISNTTMYKIMRREKLTNKKINGILYIDKEEVNNLQKMQPKVKYKYLDELNKISKDEIDHLKQKRLVSLPEAAIILGISYNSIFKLTKNKEIKTIHLGKVTRISNEELDNFRKQEAHIEKSLLTVPEAALLIGISQKNLIKLIHQKKINLAKYRGVVHRISKDEVDRFIAQVQKES